MLRKIKINTAALVCIAFIFRLLFVNIGLVSSFNTHLCNKTIKHHASALITKTETQVEPVSDSINFGFPSAAIAEEGSDDDEQFKLSTFSLSHVFYCQIQSKIENTLKKISSFNKHFAYNSSQRYLEYQVFRV